jgi:putative membrane protein
MSNKDGDHKFSESSHARDHMANERTFLAWIRTSIGIMAFGFVVEKFALFIKQIALLLGKSPSHVLPDTSHSLQGYSSIFGVLLVALGVLICLLAFIKYKKVEKQIEGDTYQPSMFLNVLLTLSVLLIGVFLVVYLSNSI